MTEEESSRVEETAQEEAARTAGAQTSEPATGELGLTGLQGHIDAIEATRVYGWAWNPERPEEKVRIDLFCGDTEIGSVPADRFRQDLADIKMGSGFHAFVFDLPAQYRSQSPDSFSAYFNETRVPLSRGGGSRLSALQGQMDAGQRDPVALLSVRVDRLEESIQQMFRILHAIRRSDATDAPVAPLQDVETINLRLQTQASVAESLTVRLGQAETALNAVQSFNDRFDLEIHDKVGRDEVVALERDLRAQKTVNWILLSLMGLIVATLVLLGAGLFYL